MVFSSLTFLTVFLPAVFALHGLMPGMTAKNALLLVASLLFYSYGEPVYVLLMIASTLFNWGLGPVEDVRLMRANVPDTVKVKAAGCIRDADTFLAMVEAGAERIGTSSGPAIVAELADRDLA